MELPVVHVVRDPVQILISSLLYHKQDPAVEPWLEKPKPGVMRLLPKSFQEKYQNVPYYKVSLGDYAILLQ